MKMNAVFRVAAVASLAGSAALVPAAAHADTLVNPVAPSFIDSCGSSADSYVIPATRGVSYFVDGVKLNAGVRKVNPARPFVEVFTVADPGYKLSQAATWSHQFDSRSSGGTGCATPTSTPGAAPSTYTQVLGGSSAPPVKSETSAAATSSSSTLPYTGFDPTGPVLAAGGLAGAGLIMLGGVGTAMIRLRRQD